MSEKWFYSKLLNMSSWSEWGSKVLEKDFNYNNFHYV